MRRLISILILATALKAAAQVPITNNAMLTTWSDSFGRGDFGQRQNFFLLSYYALMNPQFTLNLRDHSESGVSDFTFATISLPKFGVPDWGIARGKTNVINFWYVTSNGGPNSNTLRTNFMDILSAPTRMYNHAGALTNDWTQSTSLFTNVVIGLFPYYAAAGGTVGTVSQGAQVTANNSNTLYVDSFTPMSNAVVNFNGGYPANSNLFFPNPNGQGVPQYDHPGNALQLYWALTILSGLNEATNCFTAVLDWNSTSVSQTNHCTVSGISQSGAARSFTFHADRMGPAYYFPDASQTNDSTGAFTLSPPLTNAMFEVIRITNCPAGNFNIYEDGVLILANVSSTRLSAGVNFFPDVHAGALWNQKKQLLADLCDMVGTSTTNASAPYEPNGNTLIIRYESYANTVWPTNTSGVDGYIAQSDMVSRESELLAEDALIHTAAQQTNHTFSITQIIQYYAPFRIR